MALTAEQAAMTAKLLGYVVVFQKREAMTLRQYSYIKCPDGANLSRSFNVKGESTLSDKVVIDDMKERYGIG